jgi:hypothetical protein
MRNWRGEFPFALLLVLSGVKPGFSVLTKACARGASKSSRPIIGRVDMAKIVNLDAFERDGDPPSGVNIVIKG